MKGEKISLVKSTLEFIVSQLKAKDRLAIVVYDDQIDTPLPMTTLDENGKVLALKVINEIQPRNNTDLCGGLIRGIEVMSAARVGDWNEVGAIMILTDGLANHGLTKTPAILDLMGKQDLPCSVHTFGYGKDHDANMLKSISDKAGGMYFFLKDKDDIPHSFGDCLGGLLSVVGQNITIRLEPMNGADISEVQTKFKTTKENGSYVINLGDIQSEEERDILISLKLPSLTAATASLQVVKATLSYFNVISSHQCEASSCLAVARPASVSSVQVNYKVDLQRNRITAANAMAQAKALADKKEFAQARLVVEQAISALKNSLSHSDAYTESLIEDLNKTMRGLQDVKTYTDTGRSTMSAMEGAHYQQRSAGKSTTSYVTKKKMDSADWAIKAVSPKK